MKLDAGAVELVTTVGEDDVVTVVARCCGRDGGRRARYRCYDIKSKIIILQPRGRLWIVDPG